MTKVATFGRHRNSNFGPKIALERNLARGCQYLPSPKPVDRMTTTALRLCWKVYTLASTTYMRRTPGVRQRIWLLRQNSFTERWLTCASPSQRPKSLLERLESPKSRKPVKRLLMRPTALQTKNCWRSLFPPTHGLASRRWRLFRGATRPLYRSRSVNRWNTTEAWPCRGLKTNERQATSNGLLLIQHHAI